MRIWRLRADIDFGFVGSNVFSARMNQPPCLGNFRKHTPQSLRDSHAMTQTREQKRLYDSIAALIDWEEKLILWKILVDLYEERKVLLLHP